MIMIDWALFLAVVSQIDKNTVLLFQDTQSEMMGLSKEFRLLCNNRDVMEKLVPRGQKRSGAQRLHS